MLKGFDWNALDRLHKKGFISDPVSKAKSVVFTEDGLRKAERLFHALFAAHIAGGGWRVAGGGWRYHSRRHQRPVTIRKRLVGRTLAVQKGQLHFHSGFKAATSPSNSTVYGGMARQRAMSGRPPFPLFTRETAIGAAIPRPGPALDR